jgi:hypothetical protein
MAKTLAELKKARSSAVASLQKQVEKLDVKWEKDDRFWQPTADKAGSGSAIIRFLPAPQGEDLPWVRTWSHSFQGPTGKWYIENSLTTLGQEDPVSVLNSELWNNGTEAGKEIARKQKRKLNYISNILVIKDPARPECDGKVFLYKYGSKIFDKIKDVMNPPEDGLEKVEEMNPFDFWDGANFKLVFRKVDGYRNYDKSEFKETSPVSTSEAQIQALWEQEHPLLPFTDPSNFKSFEELKSKLDSVLKGGSVGTSSRSSSGGSGADDDEEEVLPPRTTRKPVVAEEDDDVDVPAPKSKTGTKTGKSAKVEEEDEEEEVVKPAKKAGKAAPAKKPAKDEEDDDDVLAHFASLAEED